MQVKQKRMAFLISQFEQQQGQQEMLKQQGKARENIADSDMCVYYACNSLKLYI